MDFFHSNTMHGYLVGAYDIARLKESTEAALGKVDSAAGQNWGERVLDAGLQMFNDEHKDYNGTVLALKMGEGWIYTATQEALHMVVGEGMPPGKWEYRKAMPVFTVKDLGLYSVRDVADLARFCKRLAEFWAREHGLVAPAE